MFLKLKKHQSSQRHEISPSSGNCDLSLEGVGQGSTRTIVGLSAQQYINDVVKPLQMQRSFHSCFCACHPRADHALHYVQAWSHCCQSKASGFQRRERKHATNAMHGIRSVFRERSSSNKVYHQVCNWSKYVQISACGRGPAVQ